MLRAYNYVSRSVFYIVTTTHLLALGDGLWDRLDLNVPTQLLPFLQLRRVGTVERVDLTQDSLVAMLLPLILRPLLPNSQFVEQGIEVIVRASGDVTLHEVARVSAGGTGGTGVAALGH